MVLLLRYDDDNTIFSIREVRKVDKKIYTYEILAKNGVCTFSKRNEGSKNPYVKRNYYTIECIEDTELYAIFVKLQSKLKEAMVAENLVY